MLSPMRTASALRQLTAGLQVLALVLLPCIAAAQQSTSIDDNRQAAPHKNVSHREASVKTEIFALEQVSKRLNSETSMSTDETRDWLVELVNRQLGFDLQSDATDGAHSDNFIEVPNSSGKSCRIQLDDRQRGYAFRKRVSLTKSAEGAEADEELIVIATEAELRGIRAALDTVEQFGVRQILVQTHVLRDTDEAIDTLEIPWSQVESPVKAGHITPTAPEADTAQGRKTFVDMYQERKQPIGQSLSPAPEGITGPTWATATSVVERTTPVLYSLLAPGEYQRVIERSKKLPDLERLMSPSVIVYSGQVATINSTVERSFVTGIKPVVESEADGQTVMFSPTVRVFSEGTKMRFLPRLQSGRELQLGCELDVCKVLDVDTIALPRPDGTGEFVVQVPEVATTQYRSDLQLPVNYALAVKVFEKDQQGNRRSLIILCRCSLRDLEATEQATLSIGNPR